MQTRPLPWVSQLDCCAIYGSKLHPQTASSTLSPTEGTFVQGKRDKRSKGAEKEAEKDKLDRGKDKGNEIACELYGSSSLKT